MEYLNGPIEGLLATPRLDALLAATTALGINQDYYLSLEDEEYTIHFPGGMITVTADEAFFDLWPMEPDGEIVRGDLNAIDEMIEFVRLLES